MPRYCVETNCPNFACYNYSNEKSKIYCKKHVKEGMIVLGQYCRTCTERGIRKYASFNYPDQTSCFIYGDKKKALIFAYESALTHQDGVEYDDNGTYEWPDECYKEWSELSIEVEEGFLDMGGDVILSIEFSG
uniref:Uncharacterized protein n=1 Tax=Marseillevirus LCMAC201 TaxID=2506605 RepID=A0A481YWQ2_9VIRU|nr:MAG: uncharacterized protein LCMAC201_01170 [Marseillevirus LCMAC201]